jgi:hypothetical protein
MADENRGGEVQTVQERDDTVFLNGNRDDAPRYILVCPMWNRIPLVLGCCLGICSGACLLARRQSADLSRYLLFGLGIGIPVILAFLVKLKGRRLQLRGRDDASVSGEIEEGADEYITVCPMTPLNKILLVPASCLLTGSKAVVIAFNIQSFSERCFLFILGIGMLMMVTSIRVKRHWYSLTVKMIFSLVKIIVVGILAGIIMPGLPDRIAEGMGYFVVMEMAGPKAKRKALWTIYLCLHVLSFIRPEEIILPGNIFFYEQMGFFELLARCVDEYAEERGVLAPGGVFLDLLGKILILAPISVGTFCCVAYIFQEIGVAIFSF